MARHFDFRHNGNVARGGVTHHLADIVLRVITAVASIRPVSRAFLGVKIKPNLLAPGAHFRQERILLDLDAPAIVIHQMPMQRVDLVQRQPVQNLFHFLLGEKMPADIQQ